MTNSLRKYGWELVCFGLLAGLVAYQIFLPPVTGLANNSDFVYVLGKFKMCPVDREKQDKIYLVTDFFIDPVQCTWESGLTTIEVPLVALARVISRPFTGHKNFDLRALAAVHLGLLLFAFGILLTITSRAGPGIRYGIPALFILIFSDIAYTCYLNSAYLDAPAYLFLLIATAVALAACLNQQRKWVIAAYLVFGTALVFAKSQHAILGLFFAVLALVLARRPATKAIRLAWVGVAVLLTGSAFTMLSLTPPHYQLFALYDVIFGRLAPHSMKPWEVLDDVGLSADDLKYVDSHAYVPTAPVYNDKWSDEFLRRTSFGKLIWYYLQNPDVVLHELNSDLWKAAPILRPKDMANFREKDGYPPATLATRFDWWSNLRSGALSVFPYHVLLFYLAPWVVWLAGWKWRGLWSPVLPLALTMSAAGMLEFAMAVLTDALDNSRHLFVFQVITEILILMCAGAVLQKVRAPRVQPAPGRSPSASPKAWPHKVALRGWGWEIGCLALFVALVGYQIFIPPVTGLANNSDFLKVMGPWSICSDHQPQNNRSLVTQYEVDPKCLYDVEITTLQRPMVGIALWLSNLFEGPRTFDLRWLAALQLGILALGFAVILGLTRRGPPGIRYGVPALFVLIFSDVAYTCYLNSAYMDAPAYTMLILAAAIAAVACFRHESWLVSVAYLVAGIGLVFSKSQHTILGFIFAGLALVFAWRSATRARRVRWAGIAVLLVASVVTMLVVTPSSYALFAIYNTVFARLGPHASSPLEFLQEIGLSAEDLPYINTNAYTPGAPIYTALWAENLLRRTSFADIALYYVKHPLVPLREMNDDFNRYTSVLRPTDMPNFREEDGIPPGTMATRFSLWSGLRSFLLRVFPYHVLLFYLAPWVAMVVSWRWRTGWLRTSPIAPLLPLASALSVAGLVEFAMSSLTDAMDISRHEFVFQVVTELLILLTVVACVARVMWWRSRRRQPEL